MGRPNRSDDEVKFTNGRNDAIVIFFKKNMNGLFLYDGVMRVRQAYLGSSSLIVDTGLNEGRSLSYNNCIETSKLLSKLSKKKPDSIVENLRGEASGGYIYLVISKDIENQVYNNLKSSLGTDPTDSRFLSELVLYADKIGKNIDNIAPCGKKSYKICTKGDISSIPDLDENDSRKLLSNVLLSHKQKQQEATMSMTSGGSSKKSSVPVSSSKPVERPAAPAPTVKKQAIPQKKENKPDEEKVEKSKMSKSSVNTIKTEIRKKVIAQDEAIDKIVNNIYMNQRYIDFGDPDMISGKANILLDGPTGTGKTFILHEVASHLKLPMALTSATNYSSVGYRGADLTDILVDLLAQSDGDLELAERGIVVFDEFDKLGSKNSDDELTMRRAIQQDLLTFISGTKFNVEYNGTSYEFDTSKLTIIGMGAFTRLREDKIAENEKKYKSSIGFSGVKEEEIVREYTVTKEDYIHEGLARELVGRFSCLASTNELGIPELKRILTDSSSSPLKHLITTGKYNECNIIIEDSLIDEIAIMAFETNVGARGLIQIVQSLKDVILNDIFSDIEELTITREHLEKAKKVNKRPYNARRH